MFVKIEKFYGTQPLILNADRIVAIDFWATGKPCIVMSNGDKYFINEEEHFTQLCDILTKRL